MADNNSTKNNDTPRSGSDMALLTPSQAIRNNSSGINQNNQTQGGSVNSNEVVAGKSRKKSRHRRRGRGATNHQHVQETQDQTNPNPSARDADPGYSEQASNKPTDGQRGSYRGKKGSRCNNKQSEENKEQTEKSAAVNNAKKNKNKTVDNNNKRNNSKQKPKKKYPWRRFLPKGTVDPITLENLQTLEYPPFALCADEPYILVTEWPVPEEDRNTGSEKSKDTATLSTTNKRVTSEADLEEVNRQRLAEQWGTTLLSSGNDHGDAKPSAAATQLSEASPPLKRPYNLFDGRALAYYMVSQLQFIDPLNRRDLTRPELVNLDDYLVRHGLYTGALKVTEAYDAKGITLSSAGAAASTAQGRADIMQQMAQQLLNSLFTGHSVTSGRGSATTGRDQTERQQAQSFSLQEQYAAMQRQDQAPSRQQHASSENEWSELLVGDSGIYGSIDNNGGGFMIIDDDENPEMRGRNDFPSLVASTKSGDRNWFSPSGALYSASHIANRFGDDSLRYSEPSTNAAFPALPTPAATQSGAADVSSFATLKKPPPTASKTLSKISGLVKKTDPDEKQRQWEAREAARRRAMISNLSYGVNPSVADGSSSLLIPPVKRTTDNINAITEEKLERNRAFAEALGVKPVTQRHYSSGWTRPTDDEFGTELNAALYPEALITMARERMPQLLKLEKKWKFFLADDKAASLPLNPMDKPSRAFVHQYAEFWSLKTESFDPEPKRYIHCVKLLETHMPLPLLSDAARNWRGPLPHVSMIRLSEHSSQQTAGQSSKSRDFPASLAEDASARFPGLLAKERPRLELAPRTMPLEVLPFEQQQDEDAAAPSDPAEDLRRRQARREEKRMKEHEAEQKKKEALENAFASDDEDEHSKFGSGGNVIDDDWGDEPEPLYTGSDDEM